LRSLRGRKNSGSLRHKRIDNKDRSDRNPTLKMSKKKPKQKKKKGGFKTVLLIAVLTLIAGIVIISVFGERFVDHKKTSPPPHSVSTPETRTISLYFSDEEGLNIKAEKRALKKGPLEVEAKEALAALIEGPKSGLESTIPRGTRLLGLRVKGGTAYADFSSEIVRNHPGGSNGELQTIYAIVDTLALNFTEIKEVQILVEGRKTETLAGHIDISQPLGPDRKIIMN
jgi:sporulation and spore germination protein